MSGIYTCSLPRKGEPHLPVKCEEGLPRSAKDFQTSKFKAPHYLPHLDGLRVLALIGVLLFHFDVPGATGGFIGVDCFLVLSGFLITRNILRSLNAGTFSFRDFYVRRFWRLYPASFTVAFSTAILSILVFPPGLAKSSVLSALASSSFVSNVYFLRLADYFDDAAHLKPLLHTWSLSLEEQFYLFWPLLLWFFTTKLPKSRNFFSVSVTAVSGLSVILNYVLNDGHPSFVFFMLPTRIFEFGIGAVCALTERLWHWETPSLVGRAIETSLSAVSTLVVIGSFFFIPQQPKPHHILLVLFSSATLIITPNSALCRYILGNRVARVMGGLTYSAYLTHWPIYVFSRYVCRGLHRGIPNFAVLTALTFGSAYLMQQYVEDPMRGKRAKYLSQLVCCLAVFVTLCLTFWVADGKGYNLNEENGFSPNRGFRSRCIDMLPGWPTMAYACRVGDHNGTNSNVTITGDSYALHLMGTYDLLGQRKGQYFTFVAFSGCPVTARSEKESRKHCQKTHKRTWEVLDGELLNGERMVAENSTVILSNWIEWGEMEKRRDTLLKIHADLAGMGHRLIVSGPPPGMSGEEKWRFPCLDLQRTALMRGLSLIHSTLAGAEKCVGKYMKPMEKNRDSANGYKKIINESLPDVKFFDMFHDNCERDAEGVERCHTLWDFENNDAMPEPGYARDGHHLALSGSLHLASVIEEKHWPLT